MSKVKKYILVKKGDYLIPFDDTDSLAVAILKQGATVTFNVMDAREILRHRKFFKLLTEVINHMPEELSEKYPKPENLLDEIKLQLGYYEKHYTLSGREVYKPKSISFATMGEKKFQEFVSESKNILLKYFLIGVSPEQFDQNFMSLIFK